MTGIFSEYGIINLNGSNATTVGNYSTRLQGGWIDGNFKALGIQLAGVLAGGLWAFTWTFIIAYVFSKIPFLSLRLSPEEEAMGMDFSMLGEQACKFAVMGLSFILFSLLFFSIGVINY